MKIAYWSPHLSHVATIQAVYNSALSLKKYLGKKCTVSIINAFGEWNKFKTIRDNDLNIYNLFTIPFLSKKRIEGFFYSRLIKIFLFLVLFFPLYFFVKRKQINYLVVHLLTSLPLVLFIIFPIKKTKLILRISGLPKLNYFRKILWRFANKKIHLVSAPTESTFNYLLELKVFDEDKVFFLPDPVFKAKNLKKKKKIKSNSILTIGRLTRQKNQILLIEAFSQIEKKYPSITLNIAGEGELKKKLINRTKELKISHKVNFLGFVDNVEELYNNSLCVIIPSLWEDPGFVMLESGFYNTPIICSNCPNGPKDFIGNNEGGYLFENNNIQDLLYKFDQFMQDDELTHRKKIIYAKKKLKNYSFYNHYKILTKHL